MKARLVVGVQPHLRLLNESNRATTVFQRTAVKRQPKVFPVSEGKAMLFIETAD
jgi:hypothetical protein